MLKAVFFDLDGTLLPMQEEEFIKTYINLLTSKAEKIGYEKKELVSVLFQGLNAMYKNDGKVTNEELFWNIFSDHYGQEKLKDKPFFDDFYKYDFKNVKPVCKENPLARKIVDYVKLNNIKCILATNPVLPGIATFTRMKFVNLLKEDFDYITLFENTSYSKPNPNYFIELLKKLNLKNDEVIMFGNNDIEDYLCAKKVGITCYLIDNTTILHQEEHLDYQLIKMEEVISTIEKEINLRKVK